MKTTLLALLMVLAPVTTLSAAPPEVGLGRIAWFDITTTNLPLSKDFYAKLFDWQFAPVQGTNLAVQINSRGEEIGTLRVAEGKIAPFNGVVYVLVADILASTARAKELGGTVVPGFPFNLTHTPGAISLVLDPAGHPLGLYSKTPMPTPSK